MKSESTPCCAQCGQPLPGAVIGGLCPRCLLVGAGLGPPGRTGGRARFAVPSVDEARAHFRDFEIRGVLGHGGMGVVFLAWQKSLDREVALKVLPAELLADEEFLDRFQREARAMAQLDHPNIARVYDAGITDDGFPYYAMERITGQPITRHGARLALALRARLELFRQVCVGVQHAHQKGILHRDLKPSNILVAEGDVGSPACPKVIDFGLARSLKALFADELEPDDLLVGTPAYMSPEQLSGVAGPADTRTDTYALGALLYELLTGTTPFDDPRARSLTASELRQLQREQPPPNPSERLATAAFRAAERGGDATPASGHPGQPWPVAPRELRGELDALVRKSLARDPAQRYQTAAELAAEVTRFFRHEPLHVVEPVAAYRFRKFARRHQPGLTAVLVVALSLVAATIFSLRQAHGARRAQLRAERVNAFLNEMLAAPDPTKDGREIKVIDLFARAGQQATNELAAEPVVLAEVLRTIGFSYYNLALYEPAEPLLRRALQLHEQFSGPTAVATARAHADVGNLCTWTSRYAEAQTELAQAVAIWRRHSPREDRDLANGLASLGAAFMQAGQDREAEPRYHEAAGLARRVMGSTNALTAGLLNELAMLRGNAGDSAAEQALYRQAIAMKRVLPQGRMELATSLGNLATSLAGSGELAEAEAAFDECLAIRREVFGDNNSEVANALVKFGSLRIRQRRPADAQAMAERALEIQRTQLPPGHRDIASALALRGRALSFQGRHAEGEAALREALDVAHQLFAPDFWAVANFESQLGECLTAQGRFADAEPLLLRGHASLLARLGAGYYLTREARARVAALYDSWGRHADASKFRP